MKTKQALLKNPLPGSTQVRTLHQTEAARTPQFRLEAYKILVPLDYSPGSRKALAYALAVANQCQAGLLLLHVVELYPIDYLFGLETAKGANQWQLAQAQAWLDQQCPQRASPGGSGIEILVAFGRPFREINRVAKERSVHLIIIATHGYTGFKRLQLGSTTERVVRCAPCPVLVLREPAREFVPVEQNTAGTFS